MSRQVSLDEKAIHQAAAFLADDPDGLRAVLAAIDALTTEPCPEGAFPFGSTGLHRLRGTSETLDTPCGVHVISPQGKRIKFIPIPEDTITNNAFGGSDMKTLYVTAGKTLYKLKTEVAGLPR